MKMASKMITALLSLSVILTACTQTNIPNTPDTGLNEAPPVEDTGDTNEIPPEPTPSEEQDVPEYPWMTPETEPLSYEEFFAEEREYDSIYPSFWSFEDGDNYAAYALNSDENGFFICESNDRKNPLHRIPNSETLLDCDKVLTDTRRLYCIRGGDLLRVDVLTGQTELLYSAEDIPDMQLCGDAVLYFLSLSDGVLLLNRLYLPTATLDLLYAQTAPDVPASFYELYGTATNRSVIYWETVSPIFWEKVLSILNGELDCPELWYTYCFTLEYMAEHPQPLSDEAVQHNFAMLQDDFNLRPRMEGCYDPTTDTYTQQYGIFDICFFGTGIHSHDEHFADYPEYTRDNG